MLFVLFVLLATTVGHAQVCAKVDKRMELTGILFSLAGLSEYNDCLVPAYRDDIRTHFDGLEDSAPVEFARELNTVHLIQYAAIPWLAEKLEIEDNKIKLSARYTTEDIEREDSRWTSERVSKFIEMLNIFHTQGRFEEFFDRHRSLYEEFEEYMTDYVSRQYLDWFEFFFGYDLPEPCSIYISPINGPHNYAIGNSILLGIGAGNDGHPTSNISLRETLIHEICHLYINLSLIHITEPTRLQSRA